MFALSMTTVRYMNAGAAITRVFKHTSLFSASDPARVEPTFYFTNLLVMVCFVMLGVFAIKRFNNKPARLWSSLTNGVTRSMFCKMQRSQPGLYALSAVISLLLSASANKPDGRQKAPPLLVRRE